MSRSRLEIKIDILRNTLRAINTSDLIRKANLSYDIFKEETNVLLEKGLIRRLKIKGDRSKFYVTTEKGYEVLSIWDKIESLLDVKWKKNLENRFSKMRNSQPRMKDIIINDWYNDIGTIASCNIYDECIYFHFPPNVKDEQMFRSTKFEIPINLNLFDLIIYAITHEEIHLVLNKLGIDQYIKDNEGIEKNILDNELSCLAIHWSLDRKIPVQSNLKSILLNSQSLKKRREGD